MDLFEYEMAGIVPVLLFFVFIWPAVLGGGILAVVLSARKKTETIARLRRSLSCNRGRHTGCVPHFGRKISRRQKRSRAFA